MSAPVQIRNPDVAAKVRELASLRGRSITEVIDEVVTPVLIRERFVGDGRASERRRRVEATLARLDALPVISPMPTDEDLYDEYGLPK